MRHTVLALIVVSGVCQFAGLSTAAGQQPTGTSSAYRPMFANTAYARPTVSPYVNLGTNTNGLSNYQTLVRPMIDERQALERQNAALGQLQQRMRGQQPPQANQREVDANSRQGVRFLHYSHYFGTVR